MKTNESILHKGLRAIVQSALRHEASEPCNAYWHYQPHRPEKPLPKPQEKKYVLPVKMATIPAPAASRMRRAHFYKKSLKKFR